MLGHVAILLGLLGVTLPLLFELKLAPSLVISVLPLCAWIAPERWRGPTLRLLLSLWGALASATLATSLALWLVPPVTAEGHHVMPIGQVVLTVPLGAVAGFWLLARAAPREPQDVQTMARGCALAAALLLATTLLHRC